MLRWTWLSIALVVHLAGAPARADRVAELGSYERAALEVGLAREKVEVDPAPEGKRVRRVRVVNLDVFGKEEGFLRIFNAVHVTTRESIIEREVFLRPGDLWDDEVVEDNRRRLNDGLFTTLVVMVPVRTGEEGTVDLLVVTRDLWSLRMNSNIEAQNRVLTQLFLSISENNLLGRRKHASFVFDMDLGSWAIGPQYVDKNVWGTRLQLASTFRANYRRDVTGADGWDALGLLVWDDLGLTGDFEGTSSRTDLVYPLWSLSRKWGAGISAAHFDGVQRRFIGTTGGDIVPRPFPLPPEIVEPPPCAVPFVDTPIDHVYDRRTGEVETSVTRSFPARVMQRLSWGYELRTDRSSAPDDLVAPQELVDCFEQEALPRSERSSAVKVGYSLFTPRYVKYRNIDSFDLTEEATLGPSVALGAAAALETIGSETNFARLSAAAAWTFDWRGDGYVRAAVGAESRLQQEDAADGALVGGWIDNSLSASVSLAAPPAAHLRVNAVASAGTRWNEQGNASFSLGGSSGLRGYPIDQFQTPLGSENHRFARGSLEVRTLPVKLLFSRAGVVGFYDVGGVATHFQELDLYHDVGLGLRLLLPQLQPFVFRLDWAVPLNGPVAGIGDSRIIFTSRQAF